MMKGILGTLTIGIAVSAIAFTAWTLAQPTEPMVAPVEYVYVQPGDTLWSIAQTHYPDHDPREVVWELRNQNGGGTVLQIGEKLYLVGEGQ